MGVLMQKMVKLGEYCDCLQNWKKYDPSHENSQSNLFMSENDSNLELPIDRVLQAQRIENGLDKQLQIIHERLKKRRKLKAEFQKQKQKQRIEKQNRQQREERERRQKIHRQKQLMLREQQLIRQKQLQADRQRKEKKERKIKANKRNKKLRDRYKQKQDQLQINMHNKSLSTTDENILNFHKDKFQQEDQSSYEQQSNQKHPIDSLRMGEKNNQVSDEGEYEEQQISYRSKKKVDTGLEVIDLEKLNPISLKEQISEMFLKKRNQRQKNNLISQTVPLNIHGNKSHRQANTKEIYNPRRDQLRLNSNREEEFGDQISFQEGVLQSTIVQKKTNYFLDDEDKEEYLREMFS